MSEPESPYVGSLFQFHVRVKRPDDEIAEAFLECFSSPHGRIVLESLFDAWCMRPIEDDLGRGMHAAFLLILDTMAQGEDVRRQRARGYTNGRG
jgi:hypothetical protein